MNVLLGMAKGLRRRLRVAAKSNGPSAKNGTISIQDIPVEVLEHIISFLPMPSIPKLMVNRAFSQTCERILYRSIHLPNTPGRTLHLCKTFVLRPDLALLVRELDIFLAWVHVLPERRGHTPPKFPNKNKTRTFTPAEALALATNVRSFKVVGIPWAFNEDMTSIRGLVCNMKLTRLTINAFPSLPNPNRDPDEGIRSYLYTILHAQPLLEHLELPDLFVIRFLEGYSSTWPHTLATFPPSESYPPLLIKWPDMTNLRSLASSACVAASFIPATPKLERLSIAFYDEENFLFMPYPEECGRRIRTLTLTLPPGTSWIQDNLGKILYSFPSVETLTVRTWRPRLGGEATEATKYVKQLSRHCHVLPLLRRLDIREVSFDRLGTELLDKRLADLKVICPLLGSVIGPWGWMWAHPPPADHRPSPGLQIIGRLSQSPKIPLSDIPNPETSRSILSRGTWALW
ncbi:hypothetical protein M407DRAFT_19848 [Tulasnella calospora MUT 4182]|uniref:F-box domain-containing protein n=1 Tax=Tulasnella calospora MUT 4182 TaxID=1051891 RepID=A0A0C3MBV7_9AGAM|nr:hypothetical protein M407DRAFT_19848 [Tulasnella calospora MUT 4182]